MAATEDEETQKKGVVAVVVKIGKHLKYSLESGRMAPSLSAGLPFRLASIHFCLDNYAAAISVALAAFLAGNHERLRSRSHMGKSSGFVTYMPL